MRTAVRFVASFIVFATVGFLLQVLPFVDRELVAPFILGITTVAGQLIDVFGGSVEIIRDHLRSPVNGFAVKVDNGCSGLEATILVCAAVLAFPTTWKMRAVGVVACSAAILGVNLIRIISLFYIGQYSMAWFEWAHLYAWDILIMVDGIIALILWIRYTLSKTPQPT